MAYAMRTKTNNSIILENFTMEKKKIVSEVKKC